MLILIICLVAASLNCAASFSLSSLHERSMPDLGPSRGGYSQAHQTVKEINVNSSGLTVSSFSYNPTAVHSEWINRLLGHQSIFQSKKSGAVNEFLGKEDLSYEEINSQSENIQSNFQLPPYAIFAPCSIEMLGYVVLDKEKPFRKEGEFAYFLASHSILEGR